MTPGDFLLRGCQTLLLQVTRRSSVTLFEFCVLQQGSGRDAWAGGGEVLASDPEV